MKGNPGRFNWIFFDLDGTIANSLPAMYKVHLDFLAKFGITGDKKEEFEELNGPAIPEIIAILKTRYKLVADKNYLANLYRNEIVNAYRSYVKPFGDSEDILKKLKNRNYKLASVTSADQEIAMGFIKSQKLEKYFQNYIFGNEVKKSKPDPEIYSLAVKRAGVSPNSVVVIEDSYNGVKSAKKAGAFVIGIANNQTKEDLLKAGADTTVSQLEEILQFLELPKTENFKKHYQIVAIGNIRLQAIENPQMEKILAKNRDVIEAVWQKTLKEKSGNLFNGTLPNFIGVNQKGDKVEVTGHFVEYKHFIAQKENPDLNLGIKPIGVSGIVIVKDGGKEYVVFAKRANKVTEYPGFLELMPSGSIDKECVDAKGDIDYRSKLLSEFTEETGLPKDYVKDISGFALVLDTNHNVYDVGCKILLKADKKLITEEFSSKEYDNQPVFVAMDDLKSFVETNRDLITPTSIAIIEAYERN